jgi:hypothetical protein
MKKHVIALGGYCVFMVGLISVTFASAFSLPLPEAKTYNGITYLSGGIGLDEREVLQRIGQDYDLKLGFAEKAGNYLSDVEVRIKDAGSNTILETISQGPWFFAKLPAGQYTILATTKGITRQHSARVAAHGQTSLYFYW